MTKHLNDNNFESEINNGITVVDFFAPWCAPCKVISPIIDEIADEMLELDNNVSVVKMNIDEEPDTAFKHNIRSIPTIMFFKDGEYQSSIVGSNVSKDKIMSQIEDLR